MAESAKVLAPNEAPYIEPGLTGQSNLENDLKQTVAPDDVKPGTPPGIGQGLMHAGNESLKDSPGERAASLYDQATARQTELDSRHQGTGDDQNR